MIGGFANRKIVDNPLRLDHPSSTRWITNSGSTGISTGFSWDRMYPAAGETAERILSTNKRGTPIPNPFLSVIDTLERRQLAVIRSVSLNQTASDPRTINGSAKVEGEARAALRDVGVEGLIAQPIN